MPSFRLYNKYNMHLRSTRSNSDVREKIFETGGTNHTEQTSKRMAIPHRSSSRAVDGIRYCHIQDRGNISINSEKEEKI